MCGIFGLVKPPKDKVIVDELRDSLAILAHRGLDDQDCYCFKNVGLGHRRLAVFDLSEKGRQPMSYRELTITFNGAIYNFPEIRLELISKGYRFTTDTDTEVILAAYHHWGPDCVHHFNGQWAFAIHDPSRNQLFCSRDRFGIKPFYYTFKNGFFYFASEIKAFTRIPGWRAQLNATRAVEYLQHQMHDHTEETFLKEVFVLKKSHNLQLDLESLKIQINAYYNLDHLFETNPTDTEVKKHFRLLLEDSIRLRLRSDVKLGTALSGGLDSSSIALSMHQLTPEQEINTFSIVYNQKPISEKPYLDAVLKRGNFQSYQASPTWDDLEMIENDVIWHQEEPVNGFSIYAQHLLFRSAAKQNVKVMLDGQGADEILAGYEKFFFVLLKKYKTHPLKLIRLLWQIHNRHRLDFKQVWNGLKQYYSKSQSHLPPWLNLPINTDHFFRRSPDDCLRSTSKNLLFELGLGALLRYEDKNAMAFGIESRVPFLDHRLVEFCLSLPSSFKIRNGIRKWILRESLKDQLPESLYKRYDKLGFATPQNQWLVKYRSGYLHSVKQHLPVLEKLIHPDFPLDQLDTLTLWRMDNFRKWMERFQVII